MRYLTIFPAICVGIALILSFLALFAGRNNDMLEQYDLLLLNTSHIGLNYFQNLPTKTHSPSSPTPSPTSIGSTIESWVHNATSKVENTVDDIEDDVEEEVKEDIKKIGASIAKEIGLKDFYSIHIMNHCEGYFSPNGTSKRNVTYCSGGAATSAFNLTAHLQQELNQTGLDFNLTNMGWTKDIDEGFHTLKLAFDACFILYVMGIIFTGLAFLSAFVAMVWEGRLTALLNISSVATGSFFLTIASIVVTAAASKAVKTINSDGKSVNINAARGDKFIAMTWAAVALMYISLICWIVEFFLGRKKAKMIPKSLE